MDLDYQLLILTWIIGLLSLERWLTRQSQKDIRHVLQATALHLFGLLTRLFPQQEIKPQHFNLIGLLEPPWSIFGWAMFNQEMAIMCQQKVHGKTYFNIQALFREWFQQPFMVLDFLHLFSIKFLLFLIKKRKTNGTLEWMVTHHPQSVMVLATQFQNTHQF